MKRREVILAIAASVACSSPVAAGQYSVSGPRWNGRNLSQKQWEELKMIKDRIAFRGDGYLPAKIMADHLKVTLTGQLFIESRSKLTPSGLNAVTILSDEIMRHNQVGDGRVRVEVVGHSSAGVGSYERYKAKIASLRRASAVAGVMQQAFGDMNEEIHIEHAGAGAHFPVTSNTNNLKNNRVEILLFPY